MTTPPPTAGDDPSPDELATPDATDEPAPLPLLTLAEGVPDVIDTDEAFLAACEALGGGSGPVAIDVERASGYRYSNRAYLIQLKRVGAGTKLIDPIAFTTLEPLIEALAGTEWILHAATQDLPSLTERGLRPDRLFDTELAGRLLGYRRVALATLVENVLGFTMLKEHSAADWSTRPLPAPWLEYAALDVEVLVELRDALASQLEAAGKARWAAEEFDHLRSFTPQVRAEPWRRTSGMHKVRGRRGLAAVRAMWETRDQIARERDVTPSRIVPDSAIVAAVLAQPRDRQALLDTQGFHGRGAKRYANQFAHALRVAAALDEDALPDRAASLDGPPAPRAWAEKDPVAADRLVRAKEATAEMSERQQVPVENLLVPDSLRRVLWSPPSEREPTALAQAVSAQLAGLSARPWQIELMAPLITEVVLAADAEAARADDSGQSSSGGSDSESDGSGT